MVGLEISIRIQPDKRVEFLQAFDLLTKLEALAGRRIDLVLFENIKEPNTFLWLEHWDNDESLMNYFQENKYRAMMGAIDAMGQLIQKRLFLVKEDS